MSTSRVIAALLLVGALAHAADAVKLNSTDCRNLVTGVQSWFPWLKCSSPPNCDLELSKKGINCDGKGRVVNIDLYGKYLDGTLPASWGKLSGLKYIDVSRNLLTGNIPDGPWSALAATLEDFTAPVNFLEGTIPSWVYNAKNLVYFDVDSNLLTGNPSPKFADLPKLSELILSSNLFSGPLQPRWAQAPRLWTLSLARNAMAGTIPAAWANWKSQIRSLNLQNNNLRGSLPAFFSKYTYLSNLQIGTNKFTGGLPSSWGALKSLASLELGGLSNLTSGTIPASWSGMKSLQFLRIVNSKIGGPIQAPFGNLPKTLVIETSSETQICGVKPKNVRVFWQSASNIDPLPACPKGK